MSNLERRPSQGPGMVTPAWYHSFHSRTSMETPGSSEQPPMAPQKTGVTPALPTAPAAAAPSTEHLRIQVPTAQTQNDGSQPKTPSTPSTPRQALLAQLQEALARHPSFADQLGTMVRPPPLARSPSSTGPRRTGWRATARHAYYVAITLALLALTVQVVRLNQFARHEEAARELWEQEQEPEIWLSRPWESLKLSTPAGRRRSLRTALIVVNVALAVRGVLVWRLIASAGVERWIQTIRMHLPVGVKVGKVINVVTLPVRGVLRPFGAWRARAAAAGAERAAAAAAERAAKEAAALSWGAYAQRKASYGADVAMGFARRGARQFGLRSAPVAAAAA